MNGETTITGYLPFINVGDNLNLDGKFLEHKVYGEQFVVDTFEKTMPETTDAIERYLSNGVIKGLGKATAKKIVKEFGEDTINVIRYEYKELTRVKGINFEKAEFISDEFNKSWGLWELVKYLEKFDISVQNTKLVYQKLGLDAIARIEENPYILVDIVTRVDFKKIDKMAMELGIPYDSIERVSSGIKYALSLITMNGHTCTLRENLETFCCQLLGIGETEFETGLIALKTNNEIIEEEREGEIEDEDKHLIGRSSETKVWVYSKPFYTAEINVASRLILLDKFKNVKHIKALKTELKNREKKNGIKLSDKQKEAIETINDHNVCVITGGPGTGKTTIIKTIIDIYKSHGMKPILCAPTGRAAKRMTETTGEEASTLHRLLELRKIDNDDKINVDLDIAPIDADVIIVDEMSMVDIFLMNYLIKGIYKGTKLVLVGDSDQLPSVGPGTVLKDIIESERISVIRLDKIFRQAAKSKIILNAHRVNNGEGFLTKKDIDDLIENSDNELNEDFFFVDNPDMLRQREEILTLCSGRLEKFGHYDFFSNIQVLTPTKKGILGTKELNESLQNTLNPKRDDKFEKKFGDVTFRSGDRVMQIKNDYDIYWEKKFTKDKKTENGSGIYNGEMGKIIQIDKDLVTVQFDDDKIAWYTNSDLDELEHAYAVTIHKSQGSEFDVVIMVVPSDCTKMLLTRNLLYTGMTRAKELLIVLSSEQVIDFMLNNTEIKKRNTGLKFKMTAMEME